MKQTSLEERVQNWRKTQLGTAGWQIKLESMVKQELDLQLQELQQYCEESRKYRGELPKPGLFGITKDKADKLALYILSDGYNQALSDLKQWIKNKRKEV